MQLNQCYNLSQFIVCCIFVLDDLYFVDLVVVDSVSYQPRFIVLFLVFFFSRL